MTRAQYLFTIFIVTDSGMYEEFDRRIKDVVQGSREVVFWMESRGVLQVENVL
jgi:hypothetical protein